MPSKTRSTLLSSTDVSDLYKIRFPTVPYVRKFIISDFHIENKSKIHRSATNYNDDSPYRKSVEDVSEQTRYILEEFIIERAAEDGVDMGLVKPIIDVDLTARKFNVMKTKKDFVVQFRNIDKFNKLRIDYEWSAMNSMRINESKSNERTIRHVLFSFLFVQYGQSSGRRQSLRNV